MNPFDESHLLSLFDAWHTPPRTRALIVEGLRAPVRWTQPTRFKAPTALCCPKMGIVINAASTVERRAALNYIFDSSVLGYLDSPFEIHASYAGKSGRRVDFNLSDGFLVMTDSGLSWDEWVPFPTLVGRCKNNPRRYLREGNVIRCPTLEAAALEMGIAYRLRSDEELNELAARNHEYLKVFLVDRAGVPTGLESELREFFQTSGYATLDELTAALPARGMSDLYAAMAEGILVTDFTRTFVGETDRCLVFADESWRETYVLAHPLAKRPTNYRPERFELKIGEKVSISGAHFSVVSQGNRLIKLVATDTGKLMDFDLREVETLIREGDFERLEYAPEKDDPLVLQSPLRNFSVAAVQTALTRIRIIDFWESGARNAETDQYSDVTIRKWVRIKHQAMERGTDLVVALTPKWNERGNRTQRLSKEALGIVETLIKKNLRLQIGAAFSRFTARWWRRSPR